MDKQNVKLFIFIYVWIFVKNEGTVTTQLSVCDYKCNSPSLLNCSGTLELHNRCCIESKESSKEIIQLDLHGCNISKLSSELEGLLHLRVVYLHENPLSDVTWLNLRNVTELQLLTLPNVTACPGGNEAWRYIKINETMTSCEDELDVCSVYNVTCPHEDTGTKNNTNSICVNVGPGHMECHCTSGYHGYKCLRKGTFPTMIFVISLVGGTVFLSGLLWVTERRLVRKKTD